GAELETLEQLLDPAGEIVGTGAKVAGVSAQVLRDGEVAIERVVLRADADHAFELVAMLREVAAVVLDDAGVGLDEPVEHAERRRLAGAVGPEQSQDLAGAALELERVDHAPAAVALHEAARGEERCAHRGRV